MQKTSVSCQVNDHSQRLLFWIWSGETRLSWEILCGRYAQVNAGRPCDQVRHFQRARGKGGKQNLLHHDAFLNGNDLHQKEGLTRTPVAASEHATFNLGTLMHDTL